MHREMHVLRIEFSLFSAIERQSRKDKKDSMAILVVYLILSDRKKFELL